jgi:hypothetical protein
VIKWVRNQETWANKFVRIAVDSPESIAGEGFGRWLPSQLKRLPNEAVAAYIGTLERWLISVGVLRDPVAAETPAGERLMAALAAEHASPSWVDIDRAADESGRLASWLKRYSEALVSVPTPTATTPTEGAR